MVMTKEKYMCHCESSHESTTVSCGSQAANCKLECSIIYILTSVCGLDISKSKLPKEGEQYVTLRLVWMFLMSVSVLFSKSLQDVGVSC